LPPLQRFALEALWNGGPGTVYDVLDRLPDGRSTPYTSILSALQKLEKAGWVTHEALSQGKGRYYVYTAALTRAEAQESTLGRLLHSLFEGDLYTMAQRLLAREGLSREELAALRKLIDERRRERKGPPHV
jgi:predicted transcriptional regulator